MRRKSSVFCGYRIKYSQTIKGVGRNKTIKGGVSIYLSDATINEINAEIKSIIKSDWKLDYIIYKLNRTLANFVSRNRYAVSAGMQLEHINKQTQMMFRKIIAPTRGAKHIDKLYKIGTSSICADLHFIKTNPFWDTSTPEEPIFKLWWNPWMIN